MRAVSTAWHSNDDDVYRAPPIDRSILPTAPRAAREPNIDRSRLPKCPPYTAFLGNLPYDVTEDSIKDFFRGLNVSLGGRGAGRIPPRVLVGFGGVATRGRTPRGSSLGFVWGLWYKKGVRDGMVLGEGGRPRAGSGDGIGVGWDWGGLRMLPVPSKDREVAGRQPG